MMGTDGERQPRRPDAAFRWLLPCLMLAWIFAAAMAAWSAVDSHPDEASHIAAGRYYLTHWLPPRATEEDLLPSLSPYGYTYLSSIDVTYYVAGKVAALASAILPCEHLWFRAFNLLLFAVLIAAYAARRDPFSPLVVLLFTPQVWYVFSYFNNDAFPLFLSLLLADLLFGSRSRVVAALSAPWRAASLLPLAGTGALLGALALTKSNYLPFLAFVGFVGCWRALGLATAAVAVASAGIYLARAHSFLPMSNPTLQAFIKIAGATLALLAAARLWRVPASRAWLARGAILALAAVAVAAPPLIFDRMLNGPSTEKAVALGAIAEKHAQPAFRPSESGDAGSFFGLRLRDKGVSAYALLVEPWQWPVKSWKSFTGYYGYMKIRGPAAYYIAMFVLHFFLLAYTVRLLLLRGEPADWQLLASVGAFGGGIILLSFYHSWINDFQAQGRYLFPVLALLAIPFTRASRWFGPRLVPALILAMFTLSSASFLFVGLRRIAKASCP